ncbi:lipoate--protein ligase [Clostridiaceae bacterium UIB06]|uniref:lipoate--protein ligase n=1 Tax=Clostridium thailandense TaxID=2794346 RepID=A0A949WVU4_9CLOT|nr:lipoate--protein ligase [Clostridium thailandense]MBV7274072.1 lipoate--protein ligase [Clostridium thailandense]MCH5137704.1 lipoate--protein ligase [Clostridiaceae bacterium UIB06]
MIFIENENTDPYINHAIEDYVLNALDEDCFMLWRNEPCILIGKNQNTLSEINIDYVNKNKLPVVRRMTGGGAIFNDLGNLNFTFISNNSGNGFADFQKFTYPIIRALKKLSIDAKLSGRNDLMIGEKKFSGNAQYSYKNKILHHGSMLFSADMTNLAQALKVKDIKFQDKAVKSVGGRVTNIKEHLKNDMRVDEFKDFIIKSVMSEQEAAKFYEFSQEEWDEIKRISDSKYATWEWNYGNSPKFNYFNEKKFKGGIIQVNVNVHKGIIKDIKLYGDFFSEKDISELEELLTSIKYLKDDVLSVLKKTNIEKYMINISNENLLEVMFT